jgi:hypothetical protein
MPSETEIEIDNLTPEIHPDDLSESDLQHLEDYQDIRINCDAHISVQLFKTQSCLDGDNLQLSHAKFFQSVELLETMCRGFQRLPDNYDVNIRAFLESDDYLKADTDSQKMMRLAHKKIVLILSKVAEAQKMQGKIKI